jgi:hypothetical protein
LRWLFVDNKKYDKFEEVEHLTNLLLFAISK